ncbi:hypothetical protein D2962_03385 [Biomaibacter acetigenes]|uniref:Four-carbon acid sugar kinase N-terminal domain-containing protein n=1 Tax=Biomaibacter acetigenes TaxID=2316383 RepID=A0A3G2R350_9FIRM|nr:hypothetical protein D2962_03385 [Biomaibacter acetigenes]RKL61453.1 hypothetical protein DXT63_16630 [Thermoanaerobacteraceae bacterium SP2]
MTEATRDPKTPVTVSDVLAVIREQTAMPAGHIPLGTILKSPECKINWNYKMLCA